MRDAGEEQGPRVDVTAGSAPAFEAELRQIAAALPERINADPERVESGLARLVLTLIELLRNVLEHQAVRRMDGGTLSEAEVERLGLALLRLDQRMQELKSTFNLTDEDLNIDLGPLGRLR
jgi:actin-like ATPase involved in cell morphogenesis